MGEAKQLLPLGETTVLGQAIHNVRRSQVNEIVLILGAAADFIRQQLPASLLEGINIVVNQAYGQGMASSLRTGLAVLDPQVDAALIVLADQPFLRPATLDHLIDQYNQRVEQYGRAKTQIVIPVYQGQRGNPVLLDRSVFSAAMALEGDTGCRAIFKQHPESTVNVEVEDEGVLLDIDNREDYTRLLKE
jgi:molybdenum cofactor cytidylyltransferase